MTDHYYELWFILHYIMEYVGNLCSPCLLHEQPKGEFVIDSSAHEYHMAGKFDGEVNLTV